MGVVAAAPARNVATDKIVRWAEAFEAALTSGDGARAAVLFAADGYWRDILALEWSYRTFGGRDEIAGVVEGTAEEARPRKFRLADGRMLDGAANLGIRPQFVPLKELLEPFFFDFSEDLYGQALEVELIEYLRPEAMFDGMDALIAQMDADCARAREVLGARNA